MYALAVLGTCWFRRPVIGGILAILGYTVLTVALTTFPMTNRLEPIHIYNAVLSAERAPGGSISRSTDIRLSTVSSWSRLSCSRYSHPDWPGHFCQHPAGSCHRLNNKFTSAGKSEDFVCRTAGARGKRVFPWVMTPGCHNS